MLRIAVLNLKGGCGKTTLATHLAAAFANRGAKTALADADRQASALDWLERRSRALAPIKGLDWREAIGDAPKKTERLVIDARAALRSKKIERLIDEAQLIVVPMQPSAFDEGAASKFFGVVEKIKPVRRGKKDVLVVGNRLRARSRAAKRLADFLEEVGREPIAHLAERARYADAAVDGVTVFDRIAKRDEPARAEWAPLLDAIERSAEAR